MNQQRDITSFFKKEGVSDRDESPEKKIKSVSVAATDTDSGSGGNTTGTDDSDCEDVNHQALNARPSVGTVKLGQKKQRKSGIDPSWLKYYPWFLKLGDKGLQAVIYLFIY